MDAFGDNSGGNSTQHLVYINADVDNIFLDGASISNYNSDLIFQQSGTPEPTYCIVRDFVFSSPTNTGNLFNSGAGWQNLDERLEFTQYKNPTATAGAAAGVDATATITSLSSDTRGRVAVNTGTGSAVGDFVTVTFSRKFLKSPFVVLQPSTSTAALSHFTPRLTSATGFTIRINDAPVDGTNYSIDYIVMG